MSESSYFELFTRNELEPVRFATGETIFARGDDADCLYVVKSGSVSLSDGAQELERVETAGIFGELALVDGSKRSATAIAATDCELVPVDEGRFRFLVTETPYFALEVMRVLAARLRRHAAAEAAGIEPAGDTVDVLA